MCWMCGLKVSSRTDSAGDTEECSSNIAAQMKWLAELAACAEHIQKGSCKYC